MERRAAFGGAVVAVILAGAPAGHAAEPASQPASRDYLETNFQHDVLASYQKELSAAYSSAGSHDARWDTAARAALDLLARYDAGNTTQEIVRPAFMTNAEVSDAQLGAASQKAIDLGCADPMIFYARALALLNRGQTEQARPWIDKAAATFKGSPYPASQHFRILMRQWELAGTAPEQSRVWSEMEPACIAMAKGPFLNPAARREMALRFAQALGLQPLDDRLKTLDAMAEKGVDRWIVDVTRARLELDAAWSARGYGLASTITPEGQRDLDAHTAKSRLAALDAWQLHPELPEPAETMIEASMLYGRSTDELLWFNRALAAERDDGPAFEQMYHALEPRWGGSNAQVLAIGQAAADSARYDTTLPWQFIRAAQAIANDDRGGDRAIFSRPEVQKTATTILDRYAAQYKGTAQEAFFQNGRAALAIAGKDYKGAKALLDGIHGPLDPVAFSMVAQSSNEAVQSVYLRTFPDRQQVNRYEQAISRGNYDNARRFLDQIVSRNNAQDRALEVLQSLQSGVKLMAAYKAGQRISLADEAGRSFWYSYDPVTITNGAIVTTGKDSFSESSHFYLMDRHYALHIAFEFTDLKATAGEYFSVAWGLGDNRVGFSAQMTPTPPEVILQEPVDPEFDKDKTLPLPAVPAKNTVDIDYFDGTPTLRINSRSIPLDFGNAGAIAGLPAKNTLLIRSNAAIRITEMTLEHLASKPTEIIPGGITPNIPTDSR